VNRAKRRHIGTPAIDVPDARSAMVAAAIDAADEILADPFGVRTMLLCQLLARPGDLRALATLLASLPTRGLQSEMGGLALRREWAAASLQRARRRGEK
jgi:hypothetical protein